MQLPIQRVLTGISITTFCVLSACAPSPCALDSDCAAEQFCDLDGEEGICTDGTRPALERVAILSIGFDPSPILLGAESTLSWTTENASDCFLTEGEGEEASVEVNGSKTMTPERTLSVSLRCEGDGSDAIDSATLVVSRPVSISTFSSSATAIDAGGSATLTWTSANSTECTLTTAPVAEGEDAEQIVEGAGELVVSPTENTTYSLSCLGEDGPAEETVDVNVWRIVSFLVDDDMEVIAAPDDVTLSFTVEGPTDCEVTGAGVTASNAATATATAPAGETVYTLTCVGVDGPIVERASVYGLSIETFAASSVDVAPAADVVLSWTAQQADQCELFEINVETSASVSLDVVVGNSGSVTANPTAQSDYQLQCTRTRGPSSATVESELLRVAVTN